MNVVTSGRAAPAALACVAAAVAATREWGGDLPVTLVVGVPGAADAGRVARDGSRVVLMPLTGWGDPLLPAALAGAAAVVACSPGDAAAVRAAGRRRDVVTAPLAAPAPAPPPGEPPTGVGALLARRRRVAPTGPLPVTVVSGRGLRPLAEALCAWRAGSAVVALPGSSDAPALRRGGALVARTGLEAEEAVALLSTAGPLHDALMRRAARVVAERGDEGLRDALREAVTLALAPAAAGLAPPPL